MYKPLVLIIPILNIFISSFCQQPEKNTDERTGNWIGGIEGANLPIYFRISGNSVGGYKADWSSPKEMAVGLPCKTVTIGKDSLFIRPATINASFYGRWLPGMDSITGVWQQNGQVLPLNLHRMKRPQTPVGPFPYRSDSVEYDNTDKTVHLAATLTYPSSGSGTTGAGRRKKYPAVILITGSGQQDRDENLFEHRPFAVIADYLTRRGIAVLRVDDRGKGNSKGNLYNATSADFAEDVLTSIRYLLSRSDIDTTRIGLIGHSEGGFIAPIVYTRWPHLRYIITLAGPGVPGWEILLRQQTDPFKSLGPAAYKTWYAFVKEKMDILNQTYGSPDSVVLPKLKAAYSRWKGGLSSGMADTLRVSQLSEAMYGMREGAELLPWVRYFSHTDPAIFLRQVKCPVLALDGGLDIQVDAERNIPAIRQALSDGGNTHVTVFIFPGLNHLFQHAVTGDIGEYAVIEETMAPETLEKMGDWIGKNE
jgi:pimeloyl-ACP methyl ester carboxylesterase